jgi:hypothetical protein
MHKFLYIKQYRKSVTDIPVLGFMDIILKNFTNPGVKERLFVKYTFRVLKISSNQIYKKKSENL